MPEAAIYKDYSFVFGQYNIRFPGQFWIMQSVPETIGKKKPPHHHLGFGILPPDPAHIVTARRFVVHIGHETKVIRQFGNSTMG